MFTQFCVAPLTFWFKQQQFALIIIILYILPHTQCQLFVRSLIRRSSDHNYSFHKQCVFTQDWLNSFWIVVERSILPFILQTKQSNECTWRRMSLASRNPYKCTQVACSVIVACLFLNFLLIYIYLFIDYIIRPIIFVFIAFIYHFRNTISIFLTIFMFSCL